MKNENTIESTLAALAAAWSKAPDMRLGQLLMNACNCDDLEIYNVEDDVLLLKLQAFIARIEAAS